MPKLVVVTDWSLPDLLPRLEDVLGAGPGIAIQHRHRGITDAQYFDEALKLADLCERHQAPLFVNGKLDVALALRCHLHLPANAMPARRARPFLPGARWLSVAVHDENEARDAAGADFALVSPVFAPGSKPDDTRTPLGPEGFVKLAAQLPCPAFALGGVSPARRVATAAGHACISSVLLAPQPRLAAKALL